MAKSLLFRLHQRHADMMYSQSVLHVPQPRLQVQQSCKPHWLSSVIHTHYYFTSSGTTALTAPVSLALIREKAPSRLTVVYLYDLPSHVAARYRHAGTHTHKHTDMSTIIDKSMDVCSIWLWTHWGMWLSYYVPWHYDKIQVDEGILQGHHKSFSNTSDIN